MNIIFDKAPHEPIILSHYRQRCERTGMVVDNRIERTPGGVPEVIEYIEMSVPSEARSGYEVPRSALWDPFGNDGMRHMESADVTGGATSGGDHG